MMAVAYGWTFVLFQIETQVFAPTTGGAEKMSADMAVPFLGSIPLDPRIGMSY